MRDAGVCPFEVNLDAVLVDTCQVQEMHAHAYFRNSVADLPAHDDDRPAVLEIKTYFETRARGDRLFRLNEHTAHANISCKTDLHPSCVLDLRGKWDPGELPVTADPVKYKSHQSSSELGIDLDEFHPHALAGNLVTNFCLYLQMGKVFRRPEPNREPGAHGHGFGIRQEKAATAESQDASMSYFSVEGVNGREVDRYSRVFSQVRPFHRTTPSARLTTHILSFVANQSM